MISNIIIAAIIIAMLGFLYLCWGDDRQHRKISTTRRREEILHTKNPPKKVGLKAVVTIERRYANPEEIKTIIRECTATDPEKILPAALGLGLEKIRFSTTLLVRPEELRRRFSEAGAACTIQIQK